MEQVSTKKRILIEALTLFSEKGYDAVSVGQIAEAVGIKAPSLYKHYKNKQDIFDAEKDVKVYENISDESLIRMGRDLFLYFLHDEYVSRFRKMLTIEQYRSRELADLYAKQYVDDTLSYQSMLFHLLSEMGMVEQETPQIMAVHFYAPIYMLLTLCDRQPEREREALQILEQHIRQFNRLYGRKEK